MQRHEGHPCTNGIGIEMTTAGWLEELENLDELEELRRMSGEPLETCPCCGGRSKVYAYKIGCYARILCWMAVNSISGQYLHIPSSGAINGGGDYAKLRYWLLS